MKLETIREAEKYATPKPMTNGDRIRAMTDELIELIQTSPADIMGNHSIGRMADHLIANGVTVQKWIPVTERLPEGECIALGYQNEMLIGHIGPSELSDTGYRADNESEGLWDVTHWMPLPELLKEG